MEVSLHNPWKDRGAVEVHFNTFLASVLDEGKWSALHPSHFTHSGRATDTYGMGERGWLGPWAGSNVSDK